MTMLSGVVSVVATLVLLSGCNLYPQDEYEEEYVVESHLIAQQPMPEVRLSTTAPFDENYYFDERAVSNAGVRIYRYDPDNNQDKIYSYREVQRGIYHPQEGGKTDPVKPGYRYRLDITLPEDNNHRIEAETVVPDTFSVKEIIRDRAVYQSPQQLEFRITTNRNNRQNYFIYSTRALEPDEANITPFWEDAVDDINDAIRIRTSIVNEENFDVNPDETLTLRLPWIGIAFYGHNEISTFSLDDNAFDFFRSQPVQVGGGAGTLSPGEIQNIIYNIDGAIGLFGSMAKLDIRVEVLPPSF